MDFVMSKLGLSVCALLVVSILGEAFAEPMADRERDELVGVAERLNRLISALLASGGEATYVYLVPSLSTGSGISMTITTNRLELASPSAKAVASPLCAIHLWQWNGTELNHSEMVDRDASCAPVVALSGDNLLIAMLLVPVQGVTTTLVFMELENP